MTLGHAPSFRTCVAIIAASAVLVGCAGRSLRQAPPVVDWSSGSQPPVSQVTPSPSDAAVTYTVRRDDTLASIAARFNTTPTNLAAWNNLGANARVRTGDVLRVAPPGAQAPVDSNPVATTQPIGNDVIEQRAIGTVMPPAQQQPSSSSLTTGVPVKTGPLGVRRPYSDAMLIELTRPDTESPAGPPIPIPSPQPPQSPTAAPSTAPPAVSTSATPTGAITWAWPTAARPTGAYDEKSKGIDFPGKPGDPVLAAADGKVTFAGTGVHGYGKLVIVQHSPNLLSVYAHNRANLVAEGATVTRGQKIAEMGNTESDAVKLHFEIRRDSKPVDPVQYLPGR